MVQTTTRVDVPFHNKSELLAVAMAALISFICIFCGLWTWMPFWKGFDRFPGLICILPFWMPYGSIFLRLYQGRVTSGLALAVAMGCALFVPGIFLLRFVVEWQRSWWIEVNFALALLLQPVMIIVAIWALKSARTERRDWQKISGSSVYGILLFAIFWLVYSPVPRQLVDNETSAKYRLRDISWNNVLQYEKDSGLSPEGSALPSGKADCEPSRLSYLLRSEPGNAYKFTYFPVVSETSVRGCRVDKTYTIAARPVAYRKTGIRSFLVDQSNVDPKSPHIHFIHIYFTSQDRAATLSDPGEDIELFTHRPN